MPTIFERLHAGERPCARVCADEATAVAMMRVARRDPPFEALQAMATRMRVRATPPRGRVA